MGPTARLVTIKRNGVDGIPFPLTLSSCLFGRGTECDIRIQLPVVSKQHCKIEISKQEAVLYNFSSTNPTQVNGSAIDEPVPLRHGDIITIIDRSFRYENESYQNRSKSPQLPEKTREQRSVRRASRASFSADPDEKERDSKARSNITEGDASGGSREHVKELKQNILTSDGSKDSAAQGPLEAPSAHSRHGSRNARDPNTGDLKDQSQVTVLGCGGELIPFPTSQFLDSGNKNDSPFKILYQSMKEELDVTSQRQNVQQYHRKSGSSAARSAEKGSADGSQEARLLGSWKSRPRSSRSTHNGPSSPAPERSQAEESKSDPEPTQTPKQAAHSSISPSPLTKAQTPVRHSEQRRSSRKRRSEDLHVAIGEESMNLDKNVDMSLKRRRVSFGGHLRPELFDENLPPNTPLKRGETPVKRKSLGSHSPTVLKKIIKEQPQSSGKEESLGISSGVKAHDVSKAALASSSRETPPRTNDQRRRSLKGSAASADEQFPQETDTPKKAGRRSGHLPPKRASISRSQHNILQMISSKRRSGASEANLIVAKSWADVVKLGVKQTQTKVVKHVPPPRQANRRQRRPNTPKKPSVSVHNECSTGHANSPCTIVIGKAQIEKVSAPARPYRMLNNFVFNQKRDYNEDLSGLTEMFKTPVKEKPQMMSTCSATPSNSENLLGKKSKVISSGEESLPIPSVNLGENMYSSAQNAAKGPSDECLPSPMLRRKCIKDEKIVKTPRNMHKITHFDIKTPVSATETLTTVCSTNKLSNYDRTMEVVKETPKQKSDSATSAKGMRRLLRTPRKSQPLDDLDGVKELLQTPKHLDEPINEYKTKVLCSSPHTEAMDTPRRKNTSPNTPWRKVDIKEGKAMHTPKATESEDKSNKALNESAKQTLDLATNISGSKRWPRTPKAKAELLEDLAGFQELFQTPAHVKDSVTEEGTLQTPCGSSQSGPVDTSTASRRRSKIIRTSRYFSDLKETF
ncbi:proliferation marker protein Ki-67 [Octodon degus]|uniref:Proliferation marker protein Ki-67 n=1 Tax=Octodon degus TaxID=10160 RepID=A0A6P6DYG7_OCTDE|nr:proliferation marker protein Ki-67 [Octodon degus]